MTFLNRLAFHFTKGVMNQHGTQAKGEPWNQQTIRGPKFVHLDLMPMLLRHVTPTRSRIYRRIIFYFPSGACWYFDFVLLRVAPEERK